MGCHIEENAINYHGLLFISYPKTMLKVHSFETFGTQDGPGIRVVIFVQGCNFHCLYCQNPDAISCEGGTPMSVAEIIKLLEEEQPYFTNGGGLTVSGGEPGLQAKEVIKLFKAAKEKGFHTALDTNGSLRTPEYKELLKIADLPLIDLKHFNPEIHKKLTGHENNPVLANIADREKMKKPFWIRYVYVPGWSDQPEHIEAMAKYLSQYKYMERLEILPYHTLGVHKYETLGWKYPLKNVAPPTPAAVKKAEKIFKKYIPQTVVH